MKKRGRLTFQIVLHPRHVLIPYQGVFQFRIFLLVVSGEVKIIEYLLIKQNITI